MKSIQFLPEVKQHSIKYKERTYVPSQHKPPVGFC